MHALDVGLRGEMKDQRQIRLKAAQRIQCPMVITHLYLKLHQRVLLAKAGNALGQVAAGCRLADHDTHAATAQALQILNLRAHLLQMRGAAADVLHKQLTRCGQAHAPGQALEQRRAQLVLQILNTPIDRRGRHVQTLGGLANRPHPGHLIQIVQKTQMVHSFS